MAGVTLAGIFSGINTTSLIQQLIAADSGQLNSLQSQQTTIQSQESAISSIQSDLTAFQQSVSALTDTSTLTGVSATSSDYSIANITAGTGATAGSHTLVVNQLATAAQEIHAGISPVETWTASPAVASADSQYLSGSQISDNTGSTYEFGFQFGTEPAVTVDLSSYAGTGVTLNQLVSAINTAAGYTAASAVANSSGQYQLQLQAQTAGTSTTLTVNSANAVSALSSISDFSQTTPEGDDTLVGAGQFVYTYNGVTRTVQTSATTTLSQLQDLINNDTSNPGVTASILDYTGSADQEFHLVLTGKDTGANYGITIGSGTTIAGFAPGSNWTQTQTAQNSEFTIDGYPSDGSSSSGPWMTRSSNTLTDVIPGATITLEGVDSGTSGVQLVLSQDNTTLTTNLQNLATQYNALVTDVDQYTGYNSTTGTGDILQGDPMINGMMDDLTNPLTLTAAGFANDTYSLPGQIGLSVSDTGVLSLDTDALNTALSANYQNVLNLIGAVGTGTSDNSDIQFNSALGTTAGGTYQVQINRDTTTGAILSASIRAQGATTWDAMDVSGNSLSGAVGTPEAGLALTATWDGSSATQTANVTVQQGFANALANLLTADTDPVNSPLAQETLGLQMEYTEVGNEITDEQTRLSNEQTNLENEFSNMETTLSTLSEQQSIFDALVGGGSSGSSSNGSTGTLGNIGQNIANANAGLTASSTTSSSLDSNPTTTAAAPVAATGG